MRLEKLTLGPYGRFADRVLKFRIDAPLHVVFGANEAGKTTALRALGDLLFGFPGQTSYGFRHDQRSLRIGGAFRLANGEALEFRRRKGNSNTFVDANDKPVSDAALANALGAVDRRTFEGEFGLTAEALRRGGEALLKAGGGLAETLAASSASLSALSKLREGLNVEADALFTPRRSGNRAFYVALDAYDAADKKVREATVTADALKTTREKHLAVQAREIGLKAEHDEASRALAKLQRAERTHRKLARLAAIAREMEVYSDLPEVDGATLGGWRAALDEDRASAARLAQLATETAAGEAEIAALAIDEKLLAAGPAVDSWREKIGAARKAAEDLPRRVEARAQAIAALDDIARRLGLAGHEALLDAQPHDGALASARAAIEARRRAEQRLADARADGERKNRERDRLAAVDFTLVCDPEPWRRRLEPLAENLADADRLRRERASIDAESRAENEAAARLDPAIADLDAFARASLPDTETLTQAARRESELNEAVRVAARAMAEAQRDAETAEKALRVREQEAAGATRADWLTARERRDLALDRLGERLDGEPAPRRQAFADARALTSAADSIGDAVVVDTERAARLQAAREDVVARREVLSHAKAERERLETARNEAGESAKALWAPANILPHAAEQMVRWAERVGALLQRREALAVRRAEAAALTEKLEAARAALRSWFADLGDLAPEDFELGFREARGKCEAMNKVWLASREAALARESAFRAAEDAMSEVAHQQSALDEALAAWPKAMQGLSLDSAATLEAAEAALEAWRAVASPRQAMQRETRSVEGIEGDLAAFARGVAEVARKVAPGLSMEKPESAIKGLVEQLAAARAAEATRAQLLKTAAQRAARQRAENLRREAAAATLATASVLLAADVGADLAPALERLDARRELEAERVKLRRDLVEIGDGFDPAALAAEQEGVDLDVLPGEIALTKQRQAELMQAIPEAARAARDAEAEYDALALGRDAAGAARERMEARGDLLDIAERWFLRHAAARLAGRAIERHRAAAQDPLVARAGELFSVATDGSFEKLGTDYDDADRPVLKAVRDDGERVDVAGLSEGARDQLFLALRLALLERRAGEPLPFLGDDILASFDDARTKRSLALLADFGRARQAIVFTHHRHVADLAREAGADVVEL